MSISEGQEVSHALGPLRSRSFTLPHSNHHPGKGGWLGLKDRLGSVVGGAKRVDPDDHKVKGCEDPNGWIRYIGKVEGSNDQLVFSD